MSTTAIQLDDKWLKICKGTALITAAMMVIISLMLGVAIAFLWPSPTVEWVQESHEHAGHRDWL